MSTASATRTTTDSGPHRVVVVGGGAGGLELVTALGRKFGRRGKAAITLIDAATTHLWKPLLHEVAAGTLNSHEDELSYMAQAHWNGFEFRLGRVAGVDRAARTVRTEAMLDEAEVEVIPARSFSYDSLVLCVGSITNDFGVEGVREHCHFLDRREQADAFHQSLLRKYFHAHARTTPLREGELHIAIAGAGATGVELAAELYQSTRQLIHYGLDRIDADRDIRITIIDAADRILPGLPPRLSDEVARELKGLGIRILTNERIVEATREGFRTGSGEFIPAETKVWAAGIKAPDFLAGIEGLECNRINQLIVRRTLQTTRDDDIFAFGDCAACPLPDDAGFVPPRAQAAHQQAALLVKSLRCRLAALPLPEYTYVDYGSLINMSRYSTVGSLMGSIARVWSSSVFVEGFVARLVYVSLYKMHQLALYGFMRVALTTIANLLTRPSRPRMKLH